MSRPSISVILPNYNYGDFFANRLNSVLAQTYPVSEIIILDDASTDNSMSIINDRLKTATQVHKNIVFKFLVNPTNSGNVFSQWQKGISMATSDYIWIAELDDSCSDRFLKEVIKPTLKDQDILLSYSGSKLVGNVSTKDKLRQGFDRLRRGHFSSSYIADGMTELSKNLAVFNSIPNVSACVFKRIPELISILEVSKTYHLCGDWYFYTELAKRGKIAYSSKKLNYHRLSEESVTGKTDLKLRFEEIQRIHSELISTTKLSKNCIKRIQKSEEKLKKAWGL